MISVLKEWYEGSGITLEDLLNMAEIPFKVEFYGGDGPTVRTIEYKNRWGDKVMAIMTGIDENNNVKYDVVVVVWECFKGYNVETKKNISAFDALRYIQDMYEYEKIQQSWDVGLKWLSTSGDE